MCCRFPVDSTDGPSNSEISSQIHLTEKATCLCGSSSINFTWFIHSKIIKLTYILELITLILSKFSFVKIRDTNIVGYRNAFVKPQLLGEVLTPCLAYISIYSDSKLFTVKMKKYLLVSGAFFAGFFILQCCHCTCKFDVTVHFVVFCVCTLFLCFAFNVAKQFLLLNSILMRHVVFWKYGFSTPRTRPAMSRAVDGRC